MFTSHIFHTAQKSKMLHLFKYIAMEIPEHPMLTYPPLFIVLSCLLIFDTTYHSLAALSFSLPSGAVLLGSEGLAAGGMVKTSTNGGH